MASRSLVVLQTSSHEAAVLAAANGGGLACLARFRGDEEPRLNRMEVPSDPPSADILLLVHKDNRDTPRIRVVLTHIGAFRQLLIRQQTGVFRRTSRVTPPNIHSRSLERP